MILTLIIILVIIFFFVLTGNKSETNKSKPKSIINSPNISKSKHFIEKNEVLLYKEKKIRPFEIKGLNYNNINPKLNGEFIGFANCVYNSHDQYAVEISTFEGIKLGYTPKGNKRLNDSLSVWHNKKIFIWGNLRFDEYYNKWFGTINIPIGFEENEIDKIKSFYSKKLDNQKLINELAESKISNDSLFKILNNHREIEKLYNSIENKNDFEYYFQYQTIQKISKKMEIEEDWKNLILLNQHKDLIDEFCGKNPNSVTKRIEKAEKITSRQQLL